VSSSTVHVECQTRIYFKRNKQEKIFENLFPARVTQQHEDEMFDQMLQYRCIEYRMSLYKQNVMMSYGFQ
jgi:hypothetical protein